MTRILLADDQQVVRQALRCLLEREDDLEVVGEAADGLEVLPMVELLKPDVLITDVAMPGLYGLELTRRVRDITPGTAVVILSRYLNEWYVTEALHSGALGYVVRQSDSAELLRAIRMAARGRHYLGSPLNQDVLGVWMARAARRLPDPYDTLTSREREILQLVAEGYSSTGIARRLTISARTAEAHRANAMRKLRLCNQAALIRYALSRGVLPPALPLPREARAHRRGRGRARRSTPLVIRARAVSGRLDIDAREGCAQREVCSLRTFRSIPLNVFRGCIDGDGSVLVYTDRYHTRKKERYVYERLYVSLVSASQPFIEWVQRSVLRLIGASGSVSVRTPNGHNPIWKLCYAKAESIRVLRWIYYAPTVPSLARKRLTAEPFLTPRVRQRRYGPGRPMVV